MGPALQVEYLHYDDVDEEASAFVSMGVPRWRSAGGGGEAYSTMTKASAMREINQPPLSPLQLPGVQRGASFSRSVVGQNSTMSLTTATALLRWTVMMWGSVSRRNTEPMPMLASTVVPRAVSRGHSWGGVLRGRRNSWHSSRTCELRCCCVLPLLVAARFVAPAPGNS
jgi:hypothetical protein